MSGIVSAKTDEDREIELNGHICRCTGYFPIKVIFAWKNYFKNVKTL